MGLSQINQNQANAERIQDKQRIADLTKAIEYLCYERELAQNAIEKIAPFMMSSIVLGEMSVGQDALIEKLSTFLMTSTLLGQMSAGQDGLIQMLCGLLQDPYFLAGHYLDLERRIGELPSVTGNSYQPQVTQLQSTMPTRPQMPAMPPPMGGVTGFARDTLRQLWESGDPSMAWKYVNQIQPTEWQRQPLFQ